MADEVHSSVTGGNGERLSLQVGTKSFGLQTRDLVTVLLLIILGGGGYLIYSAVSKDIQRLDRQHDQVLGALQTNLLRMLEAIEQANEHRTQQTEQIRQLLLQHEYNMNQDPQDRIPLGMGQPPKEQRQ